MKLNESLDEGPLYSQYKIKIAPNINAEELSETLSNLASQKILDDLDRLARQNEPSLMAAADIVAKDVAISSAILKIVN